MRLLVARIIFVLALLSLAGFSLPVAAQDASPTATPSLTATPTPAPTPITDLKAFEVYPKGQILGDYFAPTIGAGESTELVVVLANTGNVVFEGRTYVINALTAVNGGFSVADYGTELNDVSQWVDYSEEVYSIKPGTGLERTFTVSVPEGTKPGQYITAIILEDAESVTVDESQNFRQIIRFPVPVFITVPGPQEPSFAIGDATLSATESTSELAIEIVNTGNIRVRPAGSVVILSADEQELFNVPVTMGSVYARDKTSLSISLPNVLPTGSYILRIDLTDPETTVTTEASKAIEVVSAATPVASTGIQILEAVGTPKPDLEEIQFLDVSVTVDNNGDALTNGQVVLRVERDGTQVEDFVLASSLSLGGGETTVNARYIPISSWEDGNWTFEVSVESVDPTSGASSILASAELESLQVEK